MALSSLDPGFRLCSVAASWAHTFKKTLNHRGHRSCWTLCTLFVRAPGPDSLVGDASLNATRQSFGAYRQIVAEPASCWPQLPSRWWGPMSFDLRDRWVGDKFAAIWSGSHGVEIPLCRDLGRSASRSRDCDGEIRARG